MVAKDLISNLIPPLNTTDTGDKALVWMQEFNVRHLPIVKENKYFGIINEDDVLDFDDPGDPIEKHLKSQFKPAVKEYVHIFEVIKLAAEIKLSLVPVIDDEENYIGVIPLENILKYFATMSSINDSGAIIVLELNKSDYSLSEISRLVESNNANILSSYVSAPKDSVKLEVTLKLNTTDIKQVSATFERFDYTVVRSFQEAEYFEDLKDRYESFMSYLNV